MTTWRLVGEGINTCLICGCFRGGGDSRFGMIVDSIFMWLVAVPLTFLAAYVFKLPPIWVYFVMSLDELEKMPVVFIHYFRRKWLTKSAKIPAPHAVLVSTNVRLKRSPQETFTRSIPASAPSAEPAPTSARPNRFTWNKSEPTAIKPFLGRGTVLLYPDPLHTDGYGKNLPQSPRSRSPDRRRSPRPL